MKNRISFSLLTAAIITSMTAPAQAQSASTPAKKPSQLCGVAKVSEQSGAVLVFFSSRKVLSVKGEISNGAPKSGEYIIDSLSADSGGNSKPGIMDRFLTLQESGSFFESGRTESSCSGEVVRKDGELGLQLTAFEQLPWGDQQKSEVFVKAEPGKAESILKEGLTDIGSTSDVIHYNRDSSVETLYRYPDIVQRFPPLMAILETDSAIQSAALAAVKASMPEPKQGASEVGSNARFPLVDAVIWKVESENDRFLSLSSKSMNYSGVADESFDARNIMWDKKNGAAIDDVRTMFSDGLSGMHGVYCTEIKAEWIKRAGRADAVDAKGLYLGNWACPALDQVSIAFTDDDVQPFSALLFRARPQFAGPYSDGFIDVMLPMSPKTYAMLKPEYRAAVSLKFE